jgi:hypothetical protein
MKIVMQSRDEFNEVAVFNPRTKEFSKFSKTDRQDLAKIQINGFYSHINNRLICFFLYNRNLIFKSDDELIELGDDTKVLLEIADNNQSYFRIQKGGEIVFSLAYTRPSIIPPISAYQFFSMVEEEDFDIFLLIYKICNNSERKERILRKWHNEIV